MGAKPIPFLSRLDSHFSLSFPSNCPDCPEKSQAQTSALGVEAGGGDLDRDRAEQVTESPSEVDDVRAETWRVAQVRLVDQSRGWGWGEGEAPT